MKRLILCLLLAGAATAQAQAPKLEIPKLDVVVRRVDQDVQHMYEVTASGVVQAPPATVWKVLTGYDRMNEFVPDLASCRVLSRNGNEVIVEQFGTARFLFMAKSIHLIVRATETPMSSIDISLVSGDMKHYESHWELQPVAETGGTRVFYSGKLSPNFYVPGLFGAQMIRGDVERMMAALLTRLENRREQ
ncbi:SRPBCC family protein [Janthinobacterium sp.]|uniref:SRPBCC family protein n=1 Tax=Janthinobacterium sp. TaxID=1871054 RepID=UPI00293D71E1|nr:SRPBCC family protein [Janthinobacterium sp.]